MRIRLVIALALVAALAAGCAAPSNRLEVSGRVVDRATAISAPFLFSPAPDLAAGIRTQPIPAPARASGSAEPTFTGLGQKVKVAEVEVTVGERVKRGQVVARLDDRALVANVAAARANRRAALAQVDVIDARLGDVADARAEIADQQATVEGALSDARSARSQLVSQLAQARDQLASLKALQAKVRSMPKPPPGAPVPPNAPDPGQIAAGIARLEAGIAKLEGALVQLDSGISQARSGLSKLADARAQTSDARSALRSARDVAVTAAAGTSVAIDLAEAQRDLAILRAPAGGVAIRTAQRGEVLSPGAPIVTIRERATPAVDVWVAPNDRDRIALGDPARVRIDSLGSSFSAKVTRIGVRAAYPPNFLATQDIHLARAIAVRVTLDDAATQLPPGTPADVEIDLGR